MNIPISQIHFRSDRPNAVVAVPACDEADVVERCLAALATQRDGAGAPLPFGSFEILLYANNCRDETVEIADAFRAACPHPLNVISALHEPAHANAGWARKAAMDLAADRLEAAGHRDGVILTTDADSAVSPTWVAANLECLVAGVDCVAGYIDAFPAEFMRLGAGFVQRGRLEDRYLRLMAEIYAHGDPRSHDPWPNHRVSSGASLAVTLSAYRAVGGLPAVALGEDAAFTRVLETGGHKVRRPMSVSVGTSCRFEGRAKGGAADTMRLRHAVQDAPCDDDIEPALNVLWRAFCRGAMRRAHTAGTLSDPRWGRRLGWDRRKWKDTLGRVDGPVFDAVWLRLETESPVLSRRRTLRPTDLPGQIRRAEALLSRLRGDTLMPIGAAPADKPLQPVAHASGAA